MSPFLHVIDVALDFVRGVFLTLALVLAVVALMDWLVRTQRISPFSGIARFFRSVVDPFLLPVERRVVNAGGLPSSAPWWLLGAVVLVGIIVILLLNLLRGQLGSAAWAVEHGPRGVYRLLVTWIITFLQGALIVRVLLTWVSVNPFAWYARLAHVLTEWLLKPIRRFMPPFGAIDVSPIVAWIALMLAGAILLRIW